MVEFVMDFFDIVFPLNIPPLTYAIPEKFLGTIKPGIAVKAEVRKSTRHGIVLRRTSSPSRSSVKEILELATDEPVFSSSLISLIVWLSEYYFTNEGIALKSMLPGSVFDTPRIRRHLESLPDKIAPSRKVQNLPAPSEIILNAFAEGGYKTFLLPFPTKDHEVSSLLTLLPHLRNTIILVPETADIDTILLNLPNSFGDRIAILHGRLPRARRIETFHRIRTGVSDIVIGTRIAVFAPLASLSFIMVLQEQSRSYKNLEGLRYHARDVAVKRGFLDNVPVLLSSHCPSVESFHNTSRGKYLLIPGEISAERPKVEIISMKVSKNITGYLSAKTVGAAQTALRNNKAVLFLINRKGFSILQCTECGHSDCCPDCNIPFVYHKADNIIKCHYCGRKMDVPVICSKCRGTRLEMIGAGTQRIASDLEKYIKITPMRLDKDILKKPRGRKDSTLPEDNKITVGTNIVLARFHQESFDLCASLNPDASLRLPDFRSAEHLFQELLTASHLTRHDGRFLIQTRMPQHYVYRAVRGADFSFFYREELSMRRTLSYPPFSHMGVITVTSRSRMNTLPESIGKNREGEQECIGPLKSLKRGTTIIQYLVKSPSSERFRSLITDVVAAYGKIKETKVVVDIDPI